MTKLIDNQECEKPIVIDDSKTTINGIPSWNNSTGTPARIVINFESKTLEELTKYRKNIDITKLDIHRDNSQLFGYLIKMIDILSEKVL